MAETKKYLRYVPGTDEFETLDVTEGGTVRGRVTTKTAEKMRKAGYDLVSDEQWSKVNPPPAAKEQPAASGRKRILAQSSTDPSKWEALQFIGDGPRDFVRTELDTRQAEAYQRDGGFEIVPSESYTKELQRVSEGIRGERERLASVPPPRQGAEADAESVARLRKQEGREPVGPAMMRETFDDRAAESGRPVVPPADDGQLPVAQEPYKPANSGPGIWGQIAQSVLGATPLPNGPRTPEQVAQAVVSGRPAPVQGNPVQELVQSTGLGYAPAAAPPASREFSGFRGDPAVVVRQPDGTSTPGGVNATPYAASAARGGDAPSVEQPQRALTPQDAAIPEATSAGASGAAAAVRFTPGGGGGAGKELANAFAEQRKAVAARAALAEQQAAAEVARQDVELQAMQRRQQQEEERAAVRQAAMQGAEGELRTAVQGLTEPSGEVDPDRWWNSRSTGQKVAAFASAFMTGFAGRPNVILDFINQDIAAQRFNLERGDKKKAQVVEGRKLLLGTMRERFQDEVLAEAAARQAAVEQARKTAERETASFKGQDAQVRKQELLGALAQAEVEAKQAFQMRAGQLALQQMQTALEVAKFNQQAAGATTGRLAESGQAVDIATLTPEQRKRAVTVAPGRAILALNEDAAKKAADGLLSGQQTLRILDKAINLRREYGPEILPTEGKKQLQSVGLELIGALNRRNKFGALDKGTQELLERMAGGDLTSVGQVLPVLEQVRAGVAQDVGDEFQAYTGQPFGGVQSFQPRGASP